MAKRVKIPGRLESAETGNIVTGADAVMDDAKGKTQVVINSEVDAAIISLAQGKQDALTFDSAPTEGSPNPVTSAGVYTADKVLSDAIEAILLLIPSAASALNKLVDMQTMNSSIATATASFKGTYNLVSDLHLGVDATHEQIGAALDALSLGADNNDYAFVQVPNSATAPTEIRVTERYKFNGTNWLFEYDLNNSGFTQGQWNAINSGVTSLLVDKLSDLPTNTELATLLAGKQDNLTFDNVPTAGSPNPVKSGGVYARNNEIVALINALDAAKQDVLTFDNAPVAGSPNPVKSGGVYTAISAVQAAIVALDAEKQNVLTFDSTPTLGSSNPVMSSGIKTELNRIDGNITTLNDLYEALTQSALVVVQPSDTWPVASPATKTIYRVVDRVNTPPQNYSDYMWNGTAMVLMATYDNAIDDVPTAGSNNLVKSGGVFNNIGGIDISELNATENPHTPATYPDLAAALEAVPLQYRKGGMLIKYIQSFNSKYAQYRLRHTNWTTDVNYWENLRYILNLRTNLFDEKTTNLGWLYIMSGGQVTKLNGVDFGQTAPIKVTPGEIISIYNATKNTDSYWMVRLASDDIDDVVDCRRVDPNCSIDNCSYYEYIVPYGTEYISIGYINMRDLWVYSNIREYVLNLNNDIKETDAKLAEVLMTGYNCFNEDKAYFGWIYNYAQGGEQIVKVSNAGLGQTAPIKVNTGEIISIYNVTKNKDNFLLTWLNSDDIDDPVKIETIYPIKEIDGCSFSRYIVPSGVEYLTIAFATDRLSVKPIEIYKGINVGDSPFVEINALGDSLTEGYIKTEGGVPVFANPTWCDMVAENLRCNVNNYGVSATSICDGSSESFLTRLNRMTENFVDLLVIFGGTNDYGDSRALTLGTINDEPQQGTNFYASFKNLVLTAINKYPMAQILIITPMRRQNGSPNQYGISIEDIVNAEIDVAKYYGVKCFDFFHEGGINPAISAQRTAYTSDGLHPNQAGINRFLAPRFTMEIRNLTMCRG